MTPTISLRFLFAFAHVRYARLILICDAHIRQSFVYVLLDHFRFNDFVLWSPFERPGSFGISIRCCLHVITKDSTIKKCRFLRTLVSFSKNEINPIRFDLFSSVYGHTAILTCDEIDSRTQRKEWRRKFDLCFCLCSN